MRRLCRNMEKCAGFTGVAGLWFVATAPKMLHRIFGWSSGTCFHLGLDGFEDRAPAAAVDGMFVPIRTFGNGFVVALGGGKGGYAVVLGKFAGDGQVVFG